MFKTILQIHLIFFGIASIAYSQASPYTGSVTRPTLTFVVDSSHQLRPLVGIPGAASIGAPVDLGFEVTQAVVPPGHDYILAATSQSSWPILIQARGNSVIAQPADWLSNQMQQQDNNCSDADDRPLRGPRNTCRPARGDIGAIEAFAISPTGSTAAFLSQSSSQIYVFSNLWQSPVLQQVLDIRGVGSVVAMGVSDDGKSVLLGISDGTSGSLFFLKPNSSAQLIASMSHPSLITFLHNSSNAVVADDIDNAIYAWTGGQILPLAGANDGASKPIGIGVSNDNQKIFVGNALTGTVMTITAGSLTQTQPCNCNLAGLFSTNTDSVFRLTDFSGGPVLLFDASGASPRMVFVPMAAE